MADLREPLLGTEGDLSSQFRRVQSYPVLEVPDLLSTFASTTSTLLSMNSPLTCALSCSYGFVSGLRDGRIVLMDNQRNVQLIGKHERKVKCLHVNGNFLASGSQEAKKLWNLDTLQLLASVPTDNQTRGIRVNSTGEWVVSLVVPNYWEMWSLQRSAHFAGEKYNPAAVKSLGVSLDSNYAFCGTSDGVLLKRKIGDDSSLQKQLHSLQISCMVLTPDGQHVLTASHDCTIKLCDIASMEIEVSLAGHAGPVNCLILSGDGLRAYSGSNDSSIKGWDLQSKRLIATLQGHYDQVKCLALSLDEKYLASGARNGSVKLWSLESWREVGTYSGHTQSVVCVAVTEGGRYVVSGAKDGTIRIIGFTAPMNGQQSIAYLAAGEVICVQTISTVGANYYSKELQTWAVENQEAERAPLPNRQLSHLQTAETESDGKACSCACFALAGALITLLLLGMVLLD